MAVDFIFHALPFAADNSSIEKNWKACILFSRKNNQEEWMESEAYLEPSKPSKNLRRSFFKKKKITVKSI